MKRRAPVLSPGTGKPERIATVLEQEIRSGVLGFGDRLQSENELVQRFSVSRNTVRKGLEELSSRGLITTKVGIGSFVTFDGMPVDASIGWSRALANAGANAQTRTLRLEVIEDADLAARLGIESPFFIAVDRVRTNADDGHAISIERSRLPLSHELEDVPLRGLREGSLHQTLRDAGLVPDHGEEWVEIGARCRGRRNIGLPARHAFPARPPVDARRRRAPDRASPACSTRHLRCIWKF
jgi:GntR family transcriptional regulator